MSETAMEADAVVVGSGASGLAAALEAEQWGARLMGERGEVLEGNVN